MKSLSRRRDTRLAMCSAFATLAVLTLVPQLAAQTSTWVNPAGFLWHSADNWSGGIPNEAGYTAGFVDNPLGSTILVGAPITLGALDDQRPGVLSLLSDELLTFDTVGDDRAAITLGSDADTLILNIGIANAPSVNVLEVNTAEGTHLDMQGSLDRASLDLLKIGVGTLTLGADNSAWPGSLNVDGGVVNVLHDQSLGLANGETILGPEARLVAVGPRSFSDEVFRLAGGVLEVDTTQTVTIGGRLDVEVDSHISFPKPSGRLRLTGSFHGTGDLTLTEGNIEFAGEGDHTGTIHIDGAEVRVSHAMTSPLEVVTGRAIINRASDVSGDVALLGGSVSLRHPSGSTYGGRFHLYDGLLQLDTAPSASIGGLTAEAGNKAIVTTSVGRSLDVTGGLDGAGSLTIHSAGRTSFTGSSPLQNAGDLTIEGGGETWIDVPLNVGATTRLNEGALFLGSTGTSPIVQKPGTQLVFNNGISAYTGTIDVMGPAELLADTTGLVEGPITIQSGTIGARGADARLTLAGAVTGAGDLELNAQASGANLTITGPFHHAGNLTLDAGDPQTEIHLHRTDVVGDLHVLSADTTFHERLLVSGDMTVDGMQATTLAGTGNVVEGLVTVHSDVNVDGDSLFESLVISGRRFRSAKLAGDGALRVTAGIDLQKGSVAMGGGSLVGSPTIIKSTPSTVEISQIGPLFTGNVEVQEGILRLSGANPLGAGRATLMAKDAVIELDSDEIMHGTIDLGNAKGPFLSGALRTVGLDPVEYAGDLILGSEGSYINTNRLILDGAIHGGSMTFRGASNGPQSRTLEIRGNQHTYGGETTLRGELVTGATLELSDLGALHSTSKLTIGFGAMLGLSNDLVRGNVNDRVGDNIPVVLAGGEIAISGLGATGETLGAVTLSPGASQLTLDGQQTVFNVASLARQPFASLDIQARLGSTRSDASFLKISDAVASDFLGGHITIYDGQYSNFARYDSEKGVVPLPEEAYALNNPAVWAEATHALVTRGRQLTGDTDVASLTIRRGDEPALDLKASTLNVRSGGVTATGDFNEIQNGSLTAGGFDDDVELHLHAAKSWLRINADISDNAGPDGLMEAQPGGALNADNGKVHLVKSGEGSLSLGGHNTYTGQTWINQGLLEVVNSDAIPSTSDIIINGGVLRLSEGAVITPRSVTVRAGRISNFEGAIQTPLFILEDGDAGGPFLGSGEIRKTTESHAGLGVGPDFYGTIHVEQGAVTAGHLGRGTTIVHPDGVLTGRTLYGNIELRGGRLMNDINATLFVRDIDDQTESVVRVTADSHLVPTDYAAPGGIHFESPLHIDPGVTLSRVGSDRFNVDNELTLSDDSRLVIESEFSRIGVRGRAVSVGSNVVIDSRGGKSRLGGALTPTSAESLIQLIGDTSYELNFDVQLRSGNALSVRHGVNAPTLNFREEDAYLAGHGTLRNNVTVGERALLSPGDQVGHMTIDGQVTFDLGAQLRWEMRNVNSTAGANDGWDLLSASNSIRFPSRREDAYTFDVVGVDNDGQPAAVDGFDPSRPSSWLLASAPLIVGKLDAGNTALNVTGFDTLYPLPRGSDFQLRLTDNALYLDYDVLLGDMNRNKKLDAGDIDLIAQRVHAGIEDLAFDLNFDHVLDVEDHRFWVKEIRRTWFGDANLDLEFNSGDLSSVLASGEYEDSHIGNSRWATGDWNGDRDFTSEDLVLALSDGGYDRGVLAAETVPEPTSSCLWVVAFLLLQGKCIRRRDYFGRLRR